MKNWLNKASAKARNSLEKTQKQILAIDKTTVEASLKIAKERYAASVEIAARTVERLPSAKMVEKSEQLRDRLSLDSKSALEKLNRRFVKACKEMPSLSEEELLKKSIASLDGKDRIGLLGDSAAAVIGGLGGAAAAGSIASAAGASTLLGSTTLASALGGVFVTATPIGWVIGSAAVLGAAGYGAGKLIRSGSEQDSVRAELINSLKQKMQTLKSQQPKEDEETELTQLCAICIAGGILDQDDMERMLTLINEGKMPVSIAIDRLKRKATAADLIEISANRNLEKEI